MIQELPVYPRRTFSRANGMVGTRMWALDHNDDLEWFLSVVAASHWPGNPNAIPIEITEGPFQGKDEYIQRACEDPRYFQDFGAMVEAAKVQIVARYVLHGVRNCWPEKIPKPWHPPGTTLELKIRGGGQSWIVTPNIPVAQSDLMTCNENIHANPAMGTRIFIPITEYHISCDLMTRRQVDKALGDPPHEKNEWEIFVQGVNDGSFLGARREQLRFESYDITESWAATNVRSHRYRMTAHLKKRAVLNTDGSLMLDEDDDVIGWNHDYVPLRNANNPSQKYGWYRINLPNPATDSPGNVCVNRYPLYDFDAMFGGTGEIDCGDAWEGSETTMDDSTFCIPAGSTSHGLPSESAYASSVAWSSEGPV